MAAFHSMQGRIQPMWPSPPLPWVLFLSMFFLLLVFFTLVPLFIYLFFSHLCSGSVLSHFVCSSAMSWPQFASCFTNTLNPVTPLSLGPGDAAYRLITPTLLSSVWTLSGEFILTCLTVEFLSYHTCIKVSET